MKIVLLSPPCRSEAPRVKSDKRAAMADQHARYFGTELRQALVPGGKTRFEARTHLASQL
jgi:hypothetical protein